jgi:hypothetical protein
MMPRVLAAFVIAAVLGAGAEGAPLPKPFSPMERNRFAVAPRPLPGHLPKPIRWSEQSRPRHVGPTHLGGPGR